MGHTAVWTGKEMIVWGGYAGSNYLNTGGRYNPLTNSWTPISTKKAPSERSGHTAIWTGTEMIIWGGFYHYFDQAWRTTIFKTGGRYNPLTDSWTSISTKKAPSERSGHTAIWTGTEMIIWGGYAGSNYLNTGGRYNPLTNSWTPTSTINAPEGRGGHTAVWTGKEMIVWGGEGDRGYLNTGGRYNP
jgi:N-acetylneuraminic acid mutarotase